MIKNDEVNAKVLFWRFCQNCKCNKILKKLLNQLFLNDVCLRWALNKERHHFCFRWRQ